MKRKILFFACIATAGTLVIQSCKENGCGGGEDKVSSFDSHESRRMKGNCMSCHGPNGSAGGCFSVAGTVYDSLTDSVANNALVMLYTQPNGGGSLVATLEVDRSGNFYTTSPINMANGLYPAVAYTNGKSLYMPLAIYSGQCNSCHGSVNPKIWVK